MDEPLVLGDGAPPAALEQQPPGEGAAAPAQQPPLLPVLGLELEGVSTSPPAEATVVDPSVAPAPGRSSLGVAVGGSKAPGALEQQNNPTCVVVRRINGAFMGGRLIGVCLNAINAAAGPIVTQQTSQNSSYAVLTLASPEAAAVARGINMDAEAVKAGVPDTDLLVTTYCTDLRAVAVRRVDGGTISAEHVKELGAAVAASCHDRVLTRQISRDGITLFLTLGSEAGAGRALSSDINVSLHPGLPRFVVFAAKPDPRELTPSSNVLVLKNLTYEVTREQLTMYIYRVTAIPVLEVTLVPNPTNGRPCGVSFATFASIEDAGNAIQTLHMASLEGRSIRAEYRRNGDVAHMPPNKGGGGGGAAGAAGGLGGGGVISGPAASYGHVAPGVSAGAAGGRVPMGYAGVGVRQVFRGGGGGAFVGWHPGYSSGVGGGYAAGHQPPYHAHHQPHHPGGGGHLVQQHVDPYAPPPPHAQHHAFAPPPSAFGGPPHPHQQQLQQPYPYPQSYPLAHASAYAPQYHQPQPQYHHPHHAPPPQQHHYGGGGGGGGGGHGLYGGPAYAGGGGPPPGQPLPAGYGGPVPQELPRQPQPGGRSGGGGGGDGGYWQPEPAPSYSPQLHASPGPASPSPALLIPPPQWGPPSTSGWPRVGNGVFNSSILGTELGMQAPQQPPPSQQQQAQQQQQQQQQQTPQGSWI